MIPSLLVSAMLGWEAGAARVDVVPPNLPVIVNCYMLERTANKVTSPLEAKAIVLRSDRGSERIAIVVVDSCMMPRELIDKAKADAAKRTGIREDRMLVSATHTHSAPAAMACLGSDEQPGYAAFLAGRIADAIEQANKRLEPARLGAAAVEDREHTFNRRYLYRLNAPLRDPFGNSTVFANMHPGYLNPAATGPSGPVDPTLTVLSIQSRDGKRPIALLANYSMHYFSSEPLSSDYFGLFSAKMRERLKADDSFVAIMSQGTSGDLASMDYSKPKREDVTLESFTEGIAASAASALEQVRYQDQGALAMAEAKLTFSRRLPDELRLRWARELASTFAGGKPKTQTEVYAREQTFLVAEPKRELKLQALRIGDLAITAIPNEVFALTGLKLRARSPLRTQMNIELANGADGYIPPPEQHDLGGYTTWPARTAGLETGAEPQITETLVALLEEVTRMPRRTEQPVLGPYAVLARSMRPIRYFDLDNMDRAPAAAISASKRAYFLEGHEGHSMYVMEGHLKWLTLARERTLSYWYWPADTRRWEHRAITCKGNRETRWTNGHAEAAAAGVMPCTVMIPLEGKIDSLAYYERVLSAAELTRQASYKP